MLTEEHIREFRSFGISSDDLASELIDPERMECRVDRLNSDELFERLAGLHVDSDFMHWCYLRSSLAGAGQLGPSKGSGRERNKVGMEEGGQSGQ